MGKIEEYKKKIIDDVDDFKDVAGGIDRMDAACAAFETCSGRCVMLRICGNCKYFKSYAARLNRPPIDICTLRN